MRSNRLNKAMDSQLQSLTVTSDLRQALHRRMEEEQNMKVLHKLSLAVVLAIVTVLALSVTAVAAGWGAFGRMAKNEEKMDVLEGVSSAVNASVTVNGDLYVIHQAYYTGNLLFVSETATCQPGHTWGEWTEPWTFDGRPMERVLSKKFYDRTDEDGQLIPLLHPGESCRKINQGFSSQLTMEDGTVLNGEYLLLNDEDGELLQCVVFQLPNDAPDRLTLSASVYIDTEYLRCDEQNDYWRDTLDWQTVALPFTVQRSQENSVEYTYSGPMTRRWQNGSTDSLQITARVVLCREVNLAFINTWFNDNDMPQTWKDYTKSVLMDENMPSRPDDLLHQFVLTADGEASPSRLDCSGYNPATASYEVNAFFELDGSRDYKQLQLIGIWDEAYAPAQCTYDPINLE